MAFPRDTRGRGRRGLGALLALLVVAIAGGVIGLQAGSSHPVGGVSRSEVSTRTDSVRTEVGAVHESLPPLGDPPRGDGATRAIPTALEADGVLPGGTTVFDDEYPGIAKLDPVLLEALHAAALEAGGEGVTFDVTSGWRSPEYQDRLLREAVAEYGSVAEAARWVATAETSAHVAGDAVDIGPAEAQAWLAEHGADYGLCRIYANEPWHFEYRPEAPADGCPAMYADPTEDPRMQG